jgi:hypothetical protein
MRGRREGNEVGERLGIGSSFSSGVRRDSAGLNQHFGTGHVGTEWLELHQRFGTGKTRLKEALMNHGTPNQACSGFSDLYHHLLSIEECNAEHRREMTGSKQDPIQAGLEVRVTPVVEDL